MASKLERFASRSLTPQPGEQPSDPKKKGKVEGREFKGGEVILNQPVQAPSSGHKPARSWSNFLSPISSFMRARSAPPKERPPEEAERPEGYGEKPVRDEEDLDVTSEGEPNPYEGRKPSPSSAARRPEFDESKSPLRHSAAPSFEREEEGCPALVSPKKELNQPDCGSCLTKFFSKVAKGDRELALKMLVLGSTTENYDWVGDAGLRVFQLYTKRNELKQRMGIIKQLQGCGLMNSKMELIQKSEISEIVSRKFASHIVYKE
jgi:hypothetical protein